MQSLETPRGFGQCAPVCLFILVSPCFILQFHPPLRLLQALEALRVKGLAQAGKKAGRIASEGLVAQYIHAGSRCALIPTLRLCYQEHLWALPVFVHLSQNLSKRAAHCHQPCGAGCRGRQTCGLCAPATYRHRATKFAGI